MHATARAGVHWVPTSEAERAAVLRQMDRILDSRHFRNSKRYPALLEYLIRETLAGNADSLKERTLGVAVFHRPADYDANADPVVRVTAAEIRRRLAQFYQEEGRGDSMYIGLRPGSYVPEFCPVTRTPVDLEKPLAILPETDVPQADLLPTIPKPHGRYWRFAILSGAAAVLIFMTALPYLHWRTQDDQKAQIWGPFLDSPAPVLFVVGQPHAGDLDVHPSGSVYDLSAASELYLPDAIALAHLCNVLDSHHHMYQITGVTGTSLSDLRKGPAVLVGGFNNPWTMRLLAPLRFSFEIATRDHDRGTPQVLQIVDQKKQQGSPWKLDLRQPVGSINRDYAIVARFQASMTDGEVMAVAGLGAGATESASKFINSPIFTKELTARAPENWRNMNMEAVLETEVIGGRTGHTHIIATEFW
jgi:hypothetical protein